MTWKLNLDTIYVRIGRSDKAKLKNGHLWVNSVGGAILHSIDYGDSIEMIRKENPSDEFDYFSPEPSTIFIATRQTNSDSRSDFIVSRDSGRSFSRLHSMGDTNYNIINIRFKDTSEYWVLLGARFDLKPVKAGRLMYTTDQGQNWEDVYPFGPGTSWSGTEFGIGSTYNRYDGVTPGTEAGHLYLLVNYHKEQSYDLIFTTDYGKSWTGDSSHLIDKSPYHDVELIRNPISSKLWLVTSNKQKVAYSPDNAKTWHHDSITFKGDSIYTMLWKDSARGFVLGYKDSTVTFYRFLPVSGEVQHFDNYPKTYFKLHTAVSSGGKLRLLALQSLSGQFVVYDVLGRVVWTNSVIAGKSETIELNLSVKPGVYFLSYSEGSRRQLVRYVRD